MSMHSQWLHSERGLHESEDRDAWLRLESSETGGRGDLWVVASGRGKAGDAARAASGVIRTFAELYLGELAHSGDSWIAMEACLLEAGVRLQERSEEFGRPGALRAGVAAISLEGHTARVVHAGRVRVWRSDLREAKSLTELVRRSDPTVGDSTFTPTRCEVQSGLGAEDVIVVASEGVWSNINDEIVHKACVSLESRDVAEALSELARRKWCDDALTCGAIRLAPPIAGLVRSATAFVDGLGAVAGGKSTIALGSVARTNVDVQQARSSIQGELHIGSLKRLTGSPRRADRTIQLTPHHLATVTGFEGRPGAGRTMQISSDDVQRGLADATQVQEAARGELDGSGGAGHDTVSLAAGLDENPGSSPASTASMIPSAPDEGSTAPHLPDDGASADTIGILPSSVMAGADAAQKPRLKVGDRSRAMSLSQEEIFTTAGNERAGERQRTIELGERSKSRDEQTLNLPAATQRNLPLVIAVLLLVVIASGFVGAALYSQFAGESVAPESERSGDAEPTEARSSTNAPERAEAMEARRDVMPEPLPERIRARAPRSPDGVHGADRMPWYRIVIQDDEGERALWIDAHEVLAEQMSHVRRNVPDVDLVYRNATSALFGWHVCSGIDADGPDAEENRPVCATPESAEAYCNSVGRRLPSPDDWTQIIGAEPELIAEGWLRFWELPPDGPVPERDRAVQEIVGVHDGFPEILLGDERIVSRGDLPLLRGRGEDRNPVSIQPGLLTGLRERTIPLEHLPRMGFRCVVAEPPIVLDELDEAEEVASVRAEGESMERPSGESARRPATARSRRSASRSNSYRPSARAEAPPEFPMWEYDLSALQGRTQAGRARERLPLRDPIYLPESIEEYEDALSEE